MQRKRMGAVYHEQASMLPEGRSGWVLPAAPHIASQIAPGEETSQKAGGQGEEPGNEGH